ncbi:MAG: tetratricopeptide repeat protein [Planctomycetota bacterium]
MNHYRLYHVLFVVISLFVSCSSPQLDRTGFSPQDHYKFGLNWIGAHDFQRAEFSFKKAVELDSNFGDAYIQLGLVYYILYEKEVSSTKNPDTIMQYYNSAYNCFTKGLKCGSKNPQAYTGIARLQKVANRFDKAIESLLKAHELTEPDDITTEIIIHYELGDCYLAQGKYKEALAEYKEYLELVPTSQEHENIENVIKEIEKQLGISSPR